MSPGVQILIDQLANNPDAFFGPIEQDPREGYLSPRFHGWRQAIEEELIGLDAQRLQIKRPLPFTWFLTDEEKAALVKAYTEAKRQRFEAQVIYELNRPLDEQERSYKYAQPGSVLSANLAQSIVRTKEAVASTLISGSTITAIGAADSVGAYR